MTRPSRHRAPFGVVRRVRAGTGGLSPAAELGVPTLALGLALVTGLFAVDGYTSVHHGPAGELTVTRCRDWRFVTCYGPVRLTSGRVLRDVRLEGDAARVGTRLRVGGPVGHPRARAVVKAVVVALMLVTVVVRVVG